MSKLQPFRLFLNERLTVAALEIFGAVQKTVAEYQEDNDRLRRMLQITLEMKLCRNDPLPNSDAVSEEEVPPEQQHCEQEWSPSVGQEDPEPTQIKEEQEELRTSQEEEQLQGLGIDFKEFRFPPSIERGHCDEDDSLWTLTQSQIMENRNADSDPVDSRQLGAVTRFKCFSNPFDSSGNHTVASRHSSAISRNSDGLRSIPRLDPSALFDPSVPQNHSPLLDPRPSLDPCPSLGVCPSLDLSPSIDPSPAVGEHGCKPSSTSQKTHRCLDCGETFGEPLNAELQRHGGLYRRSPSEFHVCKKRYISACKLKACVLVSQSGKPGACPFCGKTFKQKAHLSRHMTIHTGKKPFSCSDCGKCFSRKETLTRHVIIHTGEKPFLCGDCGKSFNRKEHLTGHRCAFHPAVH